MSDNIKLHKNKRGGKLYPVIGQCGLDKYAHDYLGCPNCHVSRDLRCFLKDCPCEGKAFLFKVQGCEHSYSHQIQGHLSSVRIYMNRPGRSRRIVRDAMERVMKMLKDPDTVKRHRTTKRNRDDEDEGLKEFANIEDLKKDIDLTIDVTKVFDTIPYDSDITSSENEESSLGVTQHASSSPSAATHRTHRGAKRKRSGNRTVTETSAAASVSLTVQAPAASLAYSSEGDDDQELLLEM